MKKKFTIDKWVWDRFPGMRLVCLSGHGLDNSGHGNGISTYFEGAQAQVHSRLAGRPANSVEAFAAWRAVQPGKAFPAAHEALGLRVAGGNNLRSISPLVDLYNAVSLDFLSEGIAAPIGAWDSDVLPEIRLIETQGGETFTELGKAAPVTALPGEIGYATPGGEELVTRHFVWRQSSLAAVLPTTKAFFMVSEVIEPFASRSDSIKSRLSDLLKEKFQIEVASTILGEPEQEWVWEE